VSDKGLRGTARFQDKREAILDGAARLFNQHGIKGGMLADVARTVGLATNSLTYYYRKKEDLVCACLLRSMDAVGSAADTACTAPLLGERLNNFFDRYLALLAAIAEGRHPELIVFSDVLALTPPHDAAMAEAYNQMFRRVRRLLDAPAREGSATPSHDDPKRALARNARAHLLLSLTSWTRAWVTRYEPADYARVGRSVADILQHGLAAPGHAPAAEAVELPWSELGDEGGAEGDTRSAYLRAATRMVNEHSYRGASVDRIAAELQLTKGSFYHHHETKEELIAACFDRTFAVVRAAQTVAMRSAGSGLERLSRACRALLAFQMSERGPLLRITAWTGLPDVIRRDTRRTMARLGERFGALVIDGMRDGSVRIVDPSVAAQMISGMVNAAAEIDRWARGLDQSNTFELYAMPLFTGLATPPPMGPAAPRRLRSAAATPT